MPPLSTRIRLQRAGHFLGSAYAQFNLHYPETSERKCIIYSGGLGAPNAPILPAPNASYKDIILASVSTYGDRLHEDRCSCRATQACAEQPGTVIIPAFSIDRIQELLYKLEGITHRRVLKETAKVQSSASRSSISKTIASNWAEFAHYSRLSTG